MGRVASPPERPTLLFDGDCGFCRYWIGRWRGATGEAVEYVAWQQIPERFPEIPKDAFRHAVQLVEPDGTVTSGAEAVFRALAAAKGGGGPLRLYRTVPGVAPVTEGVYKVVASHRVFFSALTRWLWGGAPSPASFRSGARLFLLGLGLVYFVAFVSLGVQIRGLAGKEGIAPIAPWLDQVGAKIGWERFYYLPTLAWFADGDGALVGMCVAGAGVSLVLAAGIAPALSAAAAWILYLSLSHAVRLFLGFQWDTLLLEAGLLAVFLFPSGWRPTGWRAREPSPIVRFLLWWLLFRLMFGSGWAKLGGGDPVWRNLTAVAYHYMTQPIPTWTAWYMYQLPMWIQQASTFLMFVAELLLPVLIFAPRRLRHLAFWGLAGFQLVLIATGNFAFFNWLTICLCFPLVDEAGWPRFIRRRLGPGDAVPPRPGRLRWAGYTVAAAVVIVSGFAQAQRAFLLDTIPAPIEATLRWISPFRSLNVYGLFVDMTTSRPEISIEASMDGVTWAPYVFRWKPGDPSRRPAFVAPHQPRLDWQMWFAALGTCRRNPWLVAFMERLLEPSPEVEGLLESVPFGGRAPAKVRAVLWNYRFTSFEERARTGDWWERERKGLYCPVLSRR